MNDDLDDILSDSSLFEGFENDEKLFDTKRYQRTVMNISKSSSRKRIHHGFLRYQELFERIRLEVSSGQRQIKSIKDTVEGNKISKKNPIKQGNFYIDNGVMLYIDKIYNPITFEEISESTNRRYKVHVIYENGTENHIWLLSLISSLYDSSRHGRFITEKISDIELLGDTRITTGYIYVVKYSGQDDRLLKMPNLYKIGYASDVKKRLSNSENESTYLFSPVRLVAQFEIQNISAKLIERYLHHEFAENRISLSTTSPTGKDIQVNEWFILPLEKIQEKVQNLIVKLQNDLFM